MHEDSVVSETPRNHESSDIGNRPNCLVSKSDRNAEACVSRGDQNYSADETDRQLRDLGEWLHRKFEDSSLVDVVGILTGIILTIVGIVAAYIYDGQLKEMRHTNELTQRALNDSNNTLQATLQKLQGQIDATNTLASFAKTQADKRLS